MTMSHETVLVISATSIGNVLSGNEIEDVEPKSMVSRRTDASLVRIQRTDQIALCSPSPNLLDNHKDTKAAPMVFIDNRRP